MVRSHPEELTFLGVCVNVLVHGNSFSVLAGEGTNSSALFSFISCQYLSLIPRRVYISTIVSILYNM